MYHVFCRMYSFNNILKINGSHLSLTSDQVYILRCVEDYDIAVIAIYRDVIDFYISRRDIYRGSLAPGP